MSSSYTLSYEGSGGPDLRAVAVFGDRGGMLGKARIRGDWAPNSDDALKSLIRAMVDRCEGVLNDMLSSLRTELEQAQHRADRAERDLDQMRTVMALSGVGVDPQGNYAGTPGARVRQLLDLEEKVKAWRYSSGHELIAAIIDLTTAVDAMQTGEVTQQP